MPPLMPRHRAGTFLLVALALALGAGCGEAERAVRASGDRVPIDLDDYLYAPQRLSVPAGRVTLALRNRGRIGHTLRLRREGRLRLEVPTLLPEESAVVTRRLAPGRYRMFCAIANHEELGMWGTLVVTG
jgi:plastocyanin